MAQRSDGVETRERLLQAAQAVFAEHGYRDTTVAMLAAAAGVNPGLINYHFAGKEGLYVEAWRDSFEVARQAYPFDGGLGPEAPVQERLHALIKNRLYFLLDGGKAGVAGQMLLRELAEPSDAVQAIRLDVLRPHVEHTLSLIDEIVDGPLSDQQRQFCLMSIVHQVLTFGFRGGRKPPFLGSGRFTCDEIDALARHITTFSLAGLRAVATGAVA